VLFGERPGCPAKLLLLLTAPFGEESFFFHGLRKLSPGCFLAFYFGDLLLGVVIEQVAPGTKEPKKGGNQLHLFGLPKFEAQRFHKSTFFFFFLLIKYSKTPTPWENDREAKFASPL